MASVTAKGRQAGLAPYARRIPVPAGGAWSLDLPVGRFMARPVVEVELERAAGNTRAYDVAIATPASDAESVAIVKGTVTRFVVLKAGLIPTVLGQEKPITEAIGNEPLFLHITVRSPSP
jgi:hypothetical protein